MAAAAVGAGVRQAGMLGDFAGRAGIPLGADAGVLIRLRVGARPAIPARSVRAAVI